MRLYRIDYPVDFVELEDTKKKVLMHRSISTTSESVEKLEVWKSNIYKIFNKPNDKDISPSLLMKRLSGYIDYAYKSDDCLEFIENNQWILRFAYNVEREALINAELFEVQKEYIDFPVGLIDKDGYKKILYDKKLVPIWDIASKNSMRELIEWLLLDGEMSLDDKLSSLAFSKVHLLQDTIRENSWLLMHIDDEKRLQIMKKLRISYGPLMCYGETKYLGTDRWTIDLKMNNIPLELIPSYNKYNRIFKGFNSFDELYRKLYNCCYYKEDLDLIANNSWMLDLLDPEQRETILNLIDREKVIIPDEPIKKKEKVEDEVITKRKIISISPREGKEGLYSIQLEVPLNLYKDVKMLNMTLYTIMDGESDMTMEDFIGSSPLVLEYWPWLVEYDKYIQKKR